MSKHDDSADGAIFVAAGQFYIDRAVEAAASVKRSNPWLPITLFADRAVSSDVFSSIVQFDKGHSRSKVDHLHKTPYERTLYLDTDVRVVGDLRPMFELLDRFDLALSHAHQRSRDLSREVWRTPVPAAFPQGNSGVILYRRTEAVLNTLREWQRAYHEAGFSQDQVTLREILWTTDLRVYFLPPEYNIRFRKTLFLMSKREAEPKILHMKRFHRPKRFAFWRKAKSGG